MLVVLAHTLKPPSETRIFEKLGASIAESFSARIEVWGNDLSNEKPKDWEGIIIQREVFPGRKGLSDRIGNLGRFWNNLLHSKPDIVICCSPDIMLIALAYRLFHTTKIIWDIQENYGLNFKFQKTYGKWQFSFANLIIIGLQKIFLAKADQVWVAEEIFNSQLRNSPREKKWYLLENKVPKIWDSLNRNTGENPQSPFYLFSGVITRESGILRGINWMDVWTRSFPDWNLIVVGYCPDSVLRSELNQMKETRPWLILNNIGQWKNSRQIKNALIHSSGILMPYIESEANRGKKPTKWFEAQWAGKPALIQKNGHWSGLDGCIPVNFETPEVGSMEKIFQELKDFNPKNKLSLDWVFDVQKIKIALCSILPLQK